MNFSPAGGYLKNGKISYSQINTWIKSEKNYIKQYILGEPFIGNKYTEFGKMIHKLIEINSSGLENIPKLEYREKYFEVKYGNVILNGFMDSYNDTEIYDYKVAKPKSWNKEIVKKDNQLKFYGLCHLIKYKKLPKASIIHIETSEKNGNLFLTGNVTQYRKQITGEDIKFIKQKIREFINWCKKYESKKTNYRVSEEN